MMEEEKTFNQMYIELLDSLLENSPNKAIDWLEEMWEDKKKQ